MAAEATIAKTKAADDAATEASTAEAAAAKAKED